jgi:hypothetical protein
MDFNEHVHFGVHLGRVTSRPDIRGLPNQRFRSQHYYTYIGSAPFFLHYGILTEFGIEPYVRYGTNVPQLEPVLRILAPERTCTLKAGGVDIQCRIEPAGWIGLASSINLANAERIRGDGAAVPYEWDLPWTLRAHAHLQTPNDRFHLCVDYIRSRGHPYFDITAMTYEPLPVYRSLDFNFQIRTRMERQRFINRLDCYATAKNVLDLYRISNVRDYHWDADGNRQGVFLGFARMDIGARFGIRL